MSRAAPRTISIVVQGENSFAVHEGEEFLHHLTWEEMLGVVAELTHERIGPDNVRFGGMGTVDQLQAWQDRLRRHSDQQET